MDATVICYDRNFVENPKDLGPIALDHIQIVGSRAFIVKVRDKNDPTGHHYTTIALGSYGAAALMNDIAFVCSVPTVPPSVAPPAGRQPFLVVDPNNPKFSEELAPKIPNTNYKLPKLCQLYKPNTTGPGLGSKSDCLEVCKALVAAIILYDISLDDIRDLNHRAFLLICNQTSTIKKLPAEVADDRRPSDMDSPYLTVRIQALAPHLVRRFIHNELNRLSEMFIAFSEEEWDLGPAIDTEVLHRVIDHLRLPAMKVPAVEAMMLPRALGLMVRRGRMQ
jgi:hypothetical protein